MAHKLLNVFPDGSVEYRIAAPDPETTYQFGMYLFFEFDL